MKPPRIKRCPDCGMSMIYSYTGGSDRWWVYFCDACQFWRHFKIA